MADIKVRVGQKNAVKVISSLAGAQALSLPELLDVDADSFTNLYNGMVLVYNASINKWQATLDLTPGNTQNLDINGGTF
jgi:hypothetical protein